MRNKWNSHYVHFPLRFLKFVLNVCSIKGGKTKKGQEDNQVFCIRRPLLIWNEFCRDSDRDKCFLKALKIKTVISCRNTDGFLQVLAVFLWRTSKISFLLVSVKSLIYCENPSRNPLQEACLFRLSDSRRDSKRCSESACEPKNFSEGRAGETGEKLPIRDKESR